MPSHDDTAPAAWPTGAFKRIGVAASGGADSTALLLLLAEERGRDPSLYTCAIHADHGLPGSGAAEAECVEKLCRELRVPFFSRRLRVKRRPGQSIEMAAREARIAFYRDMAAEHRLDAVATGHHADDAAETFFLRIARGAGLTGLAGLKRVSRLPGLAIVRPLLDVSDAELRRYVESRGRGWMEDPTNADTSIARNLVRRETIPYLEKNFDPALRVHLRRTLEILRAEDEYMESQAAAAVAAGTPLGELPLAVARRAARIMLRDRGMDDGFEAAERAVASGAPPERPAPPPRRKAAAPRWTLEISQDSGWKPSSAGIGAFPASAWMDAAALGGRELEIRTRRPGDRIAPYGLEGSRKLQDVFTDAKTPRETRETLPVLADRRTGEILWVPGYRVAACAAVRSRTAPSWRFTLKADGRPAR